jgi:hypothetical protein
VRSCTIHLRLREGSGASVLVLAVKIVAAYYQLLSTLQPFSPLALTGAFLEFLAWFKNQ